MEKIAAMAAQYTGKSMLNFTMDLPPVNEQGVGGELPYGAGDIFRSTGGPTGYQVDKQLILELAGVAMEELIRMARIGEPLWVPGIDNSSCGFVLNEEEYFRAFSGGFGRRLPALKSEASRAIGIVMMSPSNLAEILMDVVRLIYMDKFIRTRFATITFYMKPGKDGKLCYMDDQSFEMNARKDQRPFK